MLAILHSISKNKTNKLYLPIRIILLLLFFSPLMLIFTPQIWPQFQTNFPDPTSKSAFFQTFYTFLSAITVLVGVNQYIVNLNKKIEPILFVNESNEINYKTKDKNLTLPVTFYLYNRGEVSINPNDVSLNMNIDSSIKIDFIRGLINDNGDEVFPRITNKLINHVVMQRLGTLIKSKVFPKRKLEIFKANLTFPMKRRYKIYYYFTTDFGFFPDNSLVVNEEPVKLGEITINIL